MSIAQGITHMYLYTAFAISGKDVKNMMYPFLTLNDDTEITHSEMKPDGQVKVYIETPDTVDGFHHAVCYLPGYTWAEINGYSETEMNYFKQLIRDNAHLILEFAQEGGILNASNGIPSLGKSDITVERLFRPSSLSNLLLPPAGRRF